ncbi:MAG: CBS domain-containing protein [Gammaproteobacteria bacterium]|nr:CBS domain-containing protein [Gammaproteobacteria bacterium]
MSTVKEMLDAKGHAVFYIDASKTVADAVALMADKDVGALPILDGDKLIGILSEQDCARKVLLQNLPPTETNITEVMTGDVIVVRESTLVDQCMALMSEKKFRHLPVVDGDRLVGIITVRDVLRFKVREQSIVIEELENYIMDETGGSG